MNETLSYEFLDRLKALPFVDALYLYGSRARGDNAQRSDIDLAVACPSATDEDWLQVLDIIGDADTLLRIDCVRLDTLKDGDGLRRNILAQAKVLYERGRQ